MQVVYMDLSILKKKIIAEVKFDNFARETIVKMIQRKPGDRIKARDIIIDLEHPVCYIHIFSLILQNLIFITLKG